MPSYSRRQTPTGGGSSSSVTGPANQQDGPGNAARLDEMRDVRTDDPSLLLQEEEEAPQRAQQRAEDVDRVTLAPGRTYLVTADDLAQSDPWRHIARNHGMMPEKLQAFNQHVTELDLGEGPELQMLPLQELAEGSEIYIPSAQELVFSECRKKATSYDEAIDLYGKMSEGPNVKMMDAARHRAEGVVGESYGTSGIEGGKFMTPNPTLAGASKKRSEVIGGQREYKVFWLPDFWKCSIFMNDVVFQAGYKPAQTGNDHYSTAGRAHEQSAYKTVNAKDAMPGDCVQRFGGRGSDQSHNVILTSFIDAKPIDDKTEEWTFTWLGAESERAAEAEKTFQVDKATGEIVGGGNVGNTLRFLRPAAKR